MKLILTGKLAGKTIVLNHHQFVNGVAVINGQPHEIAGAVRYLGVCYAAFPEGSEELKKAQSHGIQRDIQAASKPGHPEGVQGSGLQPTGEIPGAGSELRSGSSDGQPPDGNSGVVSARSGQENSGVLPEQVKKIKDVLMSLDPHVDSHWTDEGLPSVDTVAAALVDPSVDRKAIEFVMPELTRAAALESLAL